MRNIALLTLFLVLITRSSVTLAQGGLMLPIMSPTSAGMGTAATATAVDSMGAIYWNTANMSRMESQVGLSVIDVMPNSQVTSSIQGLGAGVTEGDAGGTVLPGFGLIYRPEESDWAFGLALVTVAGSGSNYPADLTNPIFSPQSNAPMAPGGLGQVSSSVLYSEFLLGVSYAISERWSVGAGPTVVASDLGFNPVIMADPDDADGSGQPRIPTDDGHAANWGGGFQVGVSFCGDSGWNFGASYKSERWMEDALWNTTDELGRPTRTAWPHEMPSIISLGASYAGCECTLFVVDVRYIDYDNARGCGDDGFGPNGNVLGAGQSSILVVTTGMQHQLTAKHTARFGYTFNQSPHDSGDVMESIFAPFYWQHTLHMGGSVSVSDAFSIDVGYSLVLPAELEGPILTPAGPVPNSSVEHRMHAHLLSLGATVKF